MDNEPQTSAFPFFHSFHSFYQRNCCFSFYILCFLSFVKGAIFILFFYREFSPFMDLFLIFFCCIICSFFLSEDFFIILSYFLSVRRCFFFPFLSYVLSLSETCRPFFFSHFSFLSFLLFFISFNNFCFYQRLLLI